MRILLSAVLLLWAILAAAAQQQPSPDDPQQATRQEVKEPQDETDAEKADGSFLAWLLRFTGLAATPSAIRGAFDGPETGDLWIADLRREPGPTRRRLTLDGGYRSPIFAGQGGDILALRWSDLVRIPVDGGAPEIVYTGLALEKLIGVAREDNSRVLVLTERHRVGELSRATGQLTLATYDAGAPENRPLVADLRGWGRHYGEIRLWVETQSRPELGRVREWTDVYFQRAGGDPRNISQCDGDSCGQPSLSAAGERVVYVRSSEP